MKFLEERRKAKAGSADHGISTDSVGNTNPPSKPTAQNSWRFQSGVGVLGTYTGFRHVTNGTHVELWHGALSISV